MRALPTDGKRGNQVNAVSLLCGLGIDGAFKRQQNLGTRGNGEGLRGWRYSGLG